MTLWPCDINARLLCGLGHRESFSLSRQLLETTLWWSNTLLLVNIDVVTHRLRVHVFRVTYIGRPFTPLLLGEREELLNIIRGCFGGQFDTKVGVVIIAMYQVMNILWIRTESKEVEPSSTLIGMPLTPQLKTNCRFGGSGGG